MIKDTKHTINEFIIPCKAWYKDTIIEKTPYITVRIYNEKGNLYGEFHFMWTGIGIQLMAYHDSWQILNKLSALTELMTKIDMEELEPTIEEFAEMLKNIGFIDKTEYIKN